MYDSSTAIESSTSAVLRCSSSTTLINTCRMIENVGTVNRPATATSGSSIQ
jgi:hypothetical protein